MHSAIIAVAMPEWPQGTRNHPKWQAFIAAIDRLTDAKPDPLDRQSGVVRIAEGVWQVNFQDNPAAVARLVSCALEHKLTYGILQLDAAPQWLPAGFDPMPT